MTFREYKSVKMKKYQDAVSRKKYQERFYAHNNIHVLVLDGRKMYEKIVSAIFNAYVISSFFNFAHMNAYGFFSVF